MDRLTAQLHYMAAHIRATTGRPCRDWTTGEIVETFGLLPTPIVTLDAWLAAFGESTEAPHMTGEDAEKANDAAIADLKAAGIIKGAK